MFKKEAGKVALEFINVPVPVDRVQEVYELLGRPKGLPTVQASVPKAEQTKEIPEAALLTRAYRESPDSMKKVFDYLADRAGHNVPMEELAGAVGYHPHQMAGALGAFGRRWKNRYDGGNIKWPFAAWWDFDVHSMVYKMSAEAAKVIKGN